MKCFLVPVLVLILTSVSCLFSNPCWGKRDSEGDAKLKIPIIVTPLDGLNLPKGSTIAMTDFLGACSDAVSDAITQRLVDHHDYSVVTREYVKDILQEHHLKMNGYLDSKTANKLGQILGANALVFGKISYCSESGVREPNFDERLQREEEKLGQDPAEEERKRSAKERKRKWRERLRRVAALLPFTPLLSPELGKFGVFASLLGHSTIRPDGGAAPGIVFGLQYDDADADLKDSKRRLIMEGYVFVVSLESGKIISASNHAGEYVFEEYHGDRFYDRKGHLKVDGNVGGTALEAFFSLEHKKFDRANLDEEQANKFALMRAARDFADSFSARMAQRPENFLLDMFSDKKVNLGFSDGINYVRLGDCARAEMHFRAMSHIHFDQMGLSELGKMLHNHGIALLCDNQPLEAIQKLDSSWRILRSLSTEEAAYVGMLMVERRLEIRVEPEPLIERYIKQLMANERGVKTETK